MSETNTEGVDGTREAEGEPEWVLASREAAAGAGHEGEDGDEAAEPIPAKKLMNDAGAIVEEMLEGLVASNCDLARLDGFPDIKVVLRAPSAAGEGDEGRVAVISGGGSGHEPAHAGFVGRGMLSAAVCGDIFASPSVDAVLAAIKATTASNGGKGALLIVKNYTGDRLNFGIAAEMAKASGIPVEMLIVGDDCALPAEAGIVGRRGIAGTVFVHKVAGAAAEAGMELAEVFALASRAAASIGTLGISLSHCTIPGSPSPKSFAGQMEVGLGIHGEAGSRVAPISSVDSLVKIIVEGILDASNNYLSLEEADGVVVLVNNLGGCTGMEMSLAARATIKYLREEKNVNVLRIGVGSFMTALDMQGVSVTLMKVDDELLSLLDATTDVHTWSVSDVSSADERVVPVPNLDDGDRTDGGQSATTGAVPAEAFRSCVVAACRALIKSEDELNAHDQKTGDGDTGTTLVRGAKAIMERLVEDSGTDWSDAALTVAAIGRTCRRSMGGTSGALYDIFFTAAGGNIRTHPPMSESDANALWLRAFRAGVDAIMKYGNAKPGYRTMLDAMLPALKALEDFGCTVEGASIAAAMSAGGAESTKRMEGLAGRSSYLPKDVLDGTPDPGATAFAIITGAVSEALMSSLNAQ